jgi:membrane-bound lytic murein transglycosylase B
MLKNLWLKKIVPFLLLWIFSGHIFASNTIAPNKPFSTRKEVRQFIQEMHIQHGFDKAALTALFKEFSSDKKVLQAMDRQYEALPWYRYSNTVITETRTKEGVAFWKQNAALLKQAEKQFKVPSEIIIAILGIESSYGKITGTFPVLQTLSTLAFDYPRRAHFFRKELEQFLLLTHEEKLDPRLIRGSYAGAIGGGQFMPSNYRHYAVDFAGKGNKDLLGNTADVIASVANYLKSHGWRYNEVITNPVIVPPQSHLKLPKTKDLKPNITLNKLRDHNIQCADPKLFKDNTQQVTFIELTNTDNTKEYWVGFYNFYVITRYNRSIHYAMAVYQLSQKIKTLYDKLDEP